jgi:hypothetical protein
VGGRGLSEVERKVNGRNSVDGKDGEQLTLDFREMHQLRRDLADPGELVDATLFLVLGRD